MKYKIYAKSGIYILGEKTTHYRSSCPEVFYKRGVPRNFVKFTGTQVFSCDFCGISRNTFFHRAPLVAASIINCFLSQNRTIQFNSLIHLASCGNLSS